MAAIPIHNETDYPLTDSMTAYIRRDAHEHFGEEVQAIRVQSGLERHAFNVRTREVRYAFSPQDFGIGPPTPLAPESLTPELPRAQRRASRRAAEPEADLLPTSVEDGEEDMEEAEPLETSLESLEEGHEDEDDEEDLFTMDDPTDDEDDEDDQDDQEEDNEDDSVFDPDAYGA